MKKCVFFLIALCISFVQFSNAQIIAGSSSAGLIISDPNINLSVSTIGNTVSDIFDLDCDSIADMRVDLYKGPTVVDGANVAYLYVLNPTFEICADTGTTTLRDVYYFNLGDTLICPDSTYWSNDTIYKLGDAGCMDCQGPFSGSNLFLAYRNISTSQTGWIKISFDLNDPSPIELTIPEVLSPCLNTALPMAGGGMSGTATCGVFTYSYTITPPSCDGACDGSIEITGLTGGTPSYNYNWSPGTPAGDGTSSIWGLCPGTYSVIFTDAVGNTCTATFVLPNGPSTISFSFSTTNVTCNGVCDGTICATGVSGGTAPYMYLWMPFGVTVPCFNGACAGTYTLCVIDGNGCQACSTVVVSEPPPLIVTENVINASCSSCCDGAVSLIPSGGTSGYTYSWTPACFPCTSLCPGTYNYCVTDANGCTSCDSVVVSFPLSSISLESDYTATIFPNPNNGNFEIVNSSPIISDVEIKITDINGKLVLQKVAQSINQKVELNTAIQNGVYFVYLHDLTSTQITVKKLVIQK